MSVEIVPSVWPGVMYSVSVVSPSVSFWPSVATMSRFGFVPVLRSSRSQSAADRMIARAEVILEVLRAARVVAVAVADNRVLDLRGVESQLLQAADDFVFDRVVEDRVDEDDPGRRRHGPGGELGLADEVQIVEDLHRFDVPLRSIRRARVAAQLLARSLAARRRLAPAHSWLNMNR